MTTELVNVEVETRGAFTDGRTVCDFSHRSQRAAQVDVAVAADSEIPAPADHDPWPTKPGIAGGTRRGSAP